jgi:hypothetical protein
MTAAVDYLFKLALQKPGYAVAIGLMGVWALTEVIARGIVYLRKKPQ